MMSVALVLPMAAKISVLTLLDPIHVTAMLDLG